MILHELQDSIKNLDTLKSFIAPKLIPARINSEEGVIIPREATEWTKLEPSTRSVVEESPFYQDNIFWIFGVVFIFLLIFILLYSRRKRKNIK